MGNTRIDQAARAKARQRRIDTEHDRAARDTRIEHAAAAVFTALTAKTRAEHDVHTAESHVGQSLRRLLQEGPPPPKPRSCATSRPPRPSDYCAAPHPTPPASPPHPRPHAARAPPATMRQAGTGGVGHD